MVVAGGGVIVLVSLLGKITFSFEELHNSLSFRKGKEKNPASSLIVFLRHMKYQ